MPNWCKNLLKTSGDGIKDVIKDVLNEKQEVDFELVDKMPEELLNTTAPSEKTNEELRKKYGADNWYDWRYDHWGVKWNASDTSISDEIIEFTTPWCPPIAWLQSLSRKHPGTKFKIQFADEFMGQAPLGEITVVNGKITQEKIAKKKQSEAEQAASDIWYGVWAENLVTLNKEKTNEN